MLSTVDQCLGTLKPHAIEQAHSSSIILSSAVAMGINYIQLNQIPHLSRVHSFSYHDLLMYLARTSYFTLLVLKCMLLWDKPTCYIDLQ